MSGFQGSPRRGYHHGNLRETLVEAARHLIAEHGPHGFTLVEAARLAEVSPAAPYRHFADRAALVREVSERGFALFRTALADAARGEADPVRVLTRMSRAYLAFSRNEPGYYSAMFQSDGLPLERTRRARTETESAAFDVLVGAITHAVAARGGTADPRTIAVEIWAMSHGVSVLAKTGDLPGHAASALDAAEAVLESAVTALLKGHLANT